jgi:uncharacterized membrane protein
LKYKVLYKTKMNHLITIYLFKKKQNSSFYLLSIIAILLSLIRVKATHSIFLLFLIWNLFLAYLPLLISSYYYHSRQNFKKHTHYFFLILWMLLLPNTFYILTDFEHLHFQNQIQFVYDFILLSCFTIAGFYAGIKSVYEIQTSFISSYSKPIGIIGIIIICYLSAFGIYLGRILRFNSWNIIDKPIQLISSILECLVLYEAQLYTFILGSLILLVYTIAFYFINNKHSNF